MDKIPTKIEELTGITDSFLRNGGYDEALGKERRTASDFRQVFHQFQAFCNERAMAKGCKDTVLVAHNSKFDVKMLNGELNRWRNSEHAESAPSSLSGIFSCSVDTLQLFRLRKWWGQSFDQGSTRLPRPKSFALGGLHSHVLNEPILNSHNAVGDIRALDRLLSAELFNGWEKSANRIQEPFIDVENVR